MAFDAKRGAVRYLGVKKAMEQHGQEKVIGEFQRTFEEGMDEFVAGNWGASKVCSEQQPHTCLLYTSPSPRD